jgi:DNA-binding protein HU-beta
MSLTKSEIVNAIAQHAGVEKKTAETMIDCLARLAYEHARDEFSVPGIGKLVVVERKARIARNPKTGATIQVPARKALKFRIAKAAKDAILGAGAPQQAGSAQLVDKAGTESSSSSPSAAQGSSAAL